MLVDRLDAYLDLEVGDDHWSDEACALADQWGAQLGAEDWLILGRRFGRRSARWRERVQGVAAMVPAQVRLGFLLESLPDDRQLEGMENLRECLQTLAPPWPVSAQLKARIEAAAQSQSGYGARFMGEVVSRLEVPEGMPDD